jgi:uncharacterized SAM-binding protein YcdF (DUF218 family)
MLFFLRKFVEALLMPVGLSGLLIIAGIVFRRRWIVVASVLALWTLSTQVVSRRMMQPLERVYESKTVAAAPNADAIVVLSGGVVRGITAPGVQWGESANRYFAGFDLAMAGKAKVIVFSAGAADNPDGPSQGSVMQQTAIRQGIQPERIILTHSVFTTEDEARAVSNLPGIHSILLVTSAFHMPRAVLLFRARGLEVSPFPTDERVPDTWNLHPLDLIPDSAPLRTAEEAMREYYGLAVYHTVLLFRPLGRLRQ